MQRSRIVQLSTTGTPAPTVVATIGATAITFPYNFPAGITTVTVTASNGILPNATRTFTVTVVDNQDPTIDCTARHCRATHGCKPLRSRQREREPGNTGNRVTTAGWLP
jgi:hypothetical protein